MDKYVIHCQVWGGITGHRQSLLKSNGQVKIFDTIQEAQEEALRLNRSMNGPYAKANFLYEVEPAGPALLMA